MGAIFTEDLQFLPAETASPKITGILGLVLFRPATDLRHRINSTSSIRQKSRRASVKSP